MPVCIVGGGGLLGRAITRLATLQGRDVRVASGIAWSNSELALDQLRRFFRESVADSRDEPWVVMWCAGAGTTGTTSASLDAEVALFSKVIEYLAEYFSENLGRLVFFYASSAGGLYAGSSEPPFSEHSEVVPLAPYGFAKVKCEDLLSSLSVRGATVAIGRIATLYGPGQDITKAQGLISQLCLAHHSGTFSKIFVSLDTLRDYLYVEDAARLCLSFVDKAKNEAPGKKTIKILCSGVTASVAEVLGIARLIFKRRLPCLHVVSSQTSVQARDLRLKSTVFTDLDRFEHRMLGSGFAATNVDIGARFRQGLQG